MIHRHFLAIFFSATLFFAALYFFFTGTIDPYGVSPIRLSISGVNQYKPRRVDIDRLIKPFEVWKYQPNTVFLGTSRVHQSMDPSVLDGTRYAVAYNASIPASSLAMNAFHLGEYIKLNPNLRTVVVELFFYNFLGKKQEKRPQTSSEYFQNTAALFLSVETLQAAIATLKFNRNNPKPTYQITSNGFFYYPPGHNSKAGFDSFPDHIWKLSEGRGKVLDESAFDSLRKIIRISEEAGLELILILTPNHAYDDFYLDFTDSWQLLEEWLTRVTSEGIVYSYSQPNAWAYETVSAEMRYWYDPYHFTLEFGRAIQLTLTDQKNNQIPQDFMVRMTPAKVHAHIESRQQAIHRWATQNPKFVSTMQESWHQWQATRSLPSGSKRSP